MRATDKQKAQMRARYVNQREMVDAIRATGCVDCGYDENIDAIQFDHVRGKKKTNVARLIGHGLPTLLAEIAKCDVVCASCHFIRSARREREARLGS